MRLLPLVPPATLVSLLMINAMAYVDHRYVSHNIEKNLMGPEYACDSAARASRQFHLPLIENIFYGAREGTDGFYEANCR